MYMFNNHMNTLKKIVQVRPSRNDTCRLYNVLSRLRVVTYLKVAPEIIFRIYEGVDLIPDVEKKEHKKHAFVVSSYRLNRALKSCKISLYFKLYIYIMQVFITHTFVST